MKRLVLYILLYSVVTACTKGGGNIYVEGRVYNPVTGEGIPNAVIVLYKRKVSGAPLQSGSSEEIKRAYTDDDGYYVIKHTGGLNSYSLTYNSMDQDGKVYYTLGFGENNMGVEEENNGNKMGVEKGKNMYVDYLMVPKSKLRYEITNVNCQGPSDNFKLFFWGTEVGYHNDYIGAVTLEGDGCYQSDDNSFAEVPMGDRYYKIEITKNGQTNSYFDTITLQENEEYVYVIDY